MTARCSVLIVDSLEESRTVLRLALERQGIAIFEAAGTMEGAELAKRHRPDLIVLDLENESFPRLGDDPESQFDESTAPLVLLGTARRRSPTPRRGQFVAKPYHYGPLVRKIEELLGATQRPLAASA